jgi:nucleoside 2-deoxyribosyltransferase
VAGQIGRRDPSTSDTSTAKIRVFLDIPYRRSYERYEETIRAALLSNGLEPIIARESSRTVTILEDVCALIDSCRYAVIDISGWNFNVALEAGYILARKIPFVLLKNQRTKAPSDLQGLKYQSYKNVETMRSRLVRWIRQNVPEAKDLPAALEARKLVERIMKEVKLTRQQAEDFLLAALQRKNE